MTTGRNARCPCGSGKKYKRCCGRYPPPPDGPWEVDLVATPASIGNDPTARPALVLVVADGRPLAADLEGHPPAEPDAVARLLAASIVQCVARTGMQPPIVRVRHARVAAALAADPAVEGIRVEAGPLPGLDAVAADFLREVAGAEHPMPTASGAATWRGWGLANAVIAEVFRAAADYHRAAPWRVVLNEQLVDAVTPQGRRWSACVLGNGGAEFGLALYQERDDFLRQLDAPSPDIAFAGFHGAMISLLFSAQHELPRHMRKEVLAKGWPVAGPDAYPTMFVANTPGGGITAAQAADLTILLRAVPAFVATHRAALLARSPGPISWQDAATGVLLSYEGIVGAAAVRRVPPPERLAPALGQGPGAEPAAALPIGSKDREHDENLRLVAAFRAALEDARLSAATVERHRMNALAFSEYLSVQGIPMRAASELDLREFLYDWYPRVLGCIRASTDNRAIPVSLRKFFAFLEREAALSLPWAAPILAHRDAFADRLASRPPGLMWGEPDARWHEEVSNDLDAHGLLPDLGMAEGERWAAGNMGPDEEMLYRELQRRWLLWRDEAVAAGVTDPADLRAELVPRQRRWETTPHPNYDGQTPLAAVRAERAARRGD